MNSLVSLGAWFKSLLGHTDRHAHQSSIIYKMTTIWYLTYRLQVFDVDVDTDIHRRAGIANWSYCTVISIEYIVSDTVLIRPLWNRTTVRVT